MQYQMVAQNPGLRAETLRQSLFRPASYAAHGLAVREAYFPTAQKTGSMFLYAKLPTVLGIHLHKTLHLLALNGVYI